MGSEVQLRRGARFAWMGPSCPEKQNKTTAHAWVMATKATTFHELGASRTTSTTVRLAFSGAVSRSPYGGGRCK